jgi:1-acyl-sn-glycerol-3-phosphate acyltransferase
MVYIRKFLFSVFVNVWGIIIPIIYCSVFITGDSKKADRGAKVWSGFIAFILEKFCNIKYEVRGLENLPKEGGYIIACKHQSMWETYIMHLIFNRPVYAYKKELLKIPFYGWFISKMSGILVDRKGGAKALKFLLSKSKEYLNDNRVIIIFPQGTRTPINSDVKDYPYQSGIVALYSALDAKIIPTALNSGVYWNKKGLTEKTGKIILEFLPAIESGLDKKEFLSKLENAIENKSKELLN